MNRSTAALFIVGLILLGVGINYTNCGLLKNEVITSPTNNEPKEVELDEGYDVVLVIGQSNTHSGQGSDPNLDGPHSEIFQLGRFETDDYKVIPASEPLHHWTAMNDFIGFALSFAKEYVTHENSQRKVLIVPCEASGTGFLNNNWNPGDSYFEDALDRTNFVLNTFKGSRLIAILWHQGEADMGHGGYAQDLDAMIHALRNGFVGNHQETPFLLGGLADTFIDYFPDYAPQIQSFIEQTPNRVTHTYFVSSEDLTPNEGDFIHFSSSSQRTLGKRYFDVFASITP